MSSALINAALAGVLAGFSLYGAPQEVTVTVAGDCSAAAAQVVAQTGGQLLSATPQGNACVVTVLVPGNGNERPRKVTVRVPM